MTVLPVAQTGASSSVVDWLASLLQTVGVPAGLAETAITVLVFVLTFVLVYGGGRRVVRPLVKRVLERRGLGAHATTTGVRAAGILLLVGAVAVAAGVSGYGGLLQSLGTVVAAGTLAVGLALQNVIQNAVAGLFIYTERPFTIGDWIKWDGNAGIVEDISLRVTRVQTFDNALLTVPNTRLTDGVIENPVANDRLRLSFLFGIGYDADVEEAADIIEEKARTHADILADPGPSVRLTELGDSSVGLQGRVWIADPTKADCVRVRAEFVSAVKAGFEAADIEMPFPQRDLSGRIEMGGPAELGTDTVVLDPDD